MQRFTVKTNMNKNLLAIQRFLQTFTEKISESTQSVQKIQNEKINRLSGR